ncbi:hypothetical protein LTR16_012751, partial [Cryomyces antarcticus]
MRLAETINANEGAGEEAEQRDEVMGDGDSDSGEEEDDNAIIAPRKKVERVIDEDDEDEDHDESAETAGHRSPVLAVNGAAG